LFAADVALFGEKPRLELQPGKKSGITDEKWRNHCFTTE
jgi:hypothetical protein